MEADGGGTKKRVSPVPTDLIKKEKDAAKSDSKVSEKYSSSIGQ